MKLAIYTTATTGYTHALVAQAHKVLACIQESNHKFEDILIMVVTNNPDSVKDCIVFYKKHLPKADIRCISDFRFGTGFENYKSDAQLLISQMRTAASVEALSWGADFCLSLDCDVLPPSNALRTMIDALQWDNKYYEVAFCPYPSHGGGPFLGGRGTPERPILPDIYPDEKRIPKEIEEELRFLQQNPNPERSQEIEKLMESFPNMANVYEANSVRWRKRGWFDFAYPALGKGAMVPVEWIGFGCTLMNRRALALCDWTGYCGGGTEDLFINFRRWYPANIKICCIPHCPCDHVVRHPTRKGEYVHIITGHELSGEYEGHLRQHPVPWYSQEPGERFRPENDGSLMRKPPEDQLMFNF